MTDSVQRFNTRVADYVKYRPHYPREILSFLEAECGLTRETVIADVGCGTGISSALFIQNGNKVFGVEPNEPMRAAAIDLFRDAPNFIPVVGTSDETTLPDTSVGMIVAAQAFHWFDAAPTRSEFRRIGRDGAYTVLIWNERHLNSTPFHVEYESLLLKYSRDYPVVRHENIAGGEIGRFYETEYGSATFPNFQIFDLEGLKGRMLSASYMPTAEHPAFPGMIAELQNLFAKHAENGKIRVLYDTNVYFSRL